MDTWKEFEANELTHSGAHHLLAIHEVGAPYGGWARVSDIARRLNITRGSVSINLRTLKKRGWVETDEHRLVKLSPKGLSVVHSVMAKRVIVKTFLRDVLGISEAQAEIDSCKIEHLISHSTGERLVQEVEQQALDAYKDFLPRVAGDPVLGDFIRKQVEIESEHVQEIRDFVQAKGAVKLVVRS